MLYVTFMLPLKINTFSLGNAINNAAIKNQLQYFFPLVRKHTPLDSVSDGAREAGLCFWRMRIFFQNVYYLYFHYSVL